MQTTFSTLSMKSDRSVSTKDGRCASRPWLVITDPSGDFLGRAFRAFDLTGGDQVKPYWNVGTIFWNQHTGVLKKWNGFRFEIFTPQATQKKTGQTA